MQLKHECVRNLLLTIESLEFGEELTLRNYTEKQLISGYEDVDIYYTVERLQEAGFIDVSIPKMIGKHASFRIKSLTWEGHQFLDNIRDEKVWVQTKNIASKVAGASLNVLSQVAASVIKSSLGL